MGTIKDIAKIKIGGANFIQPTILPVFQKAVNSPIKRVSLVFGENGSGKSTIARGIFNHTHYPDEKHEISAEFLDEKNNSIVIPDAEQHIFVFDEDYIRQQVGVTSRNGLDTIVILGEAKELDEKIKQLKSKEHKKKEEYAKQENVIEQLKNPKSVSSPYYYFDRAKSILKADGGWSEREGKLKGYKTKASVTDNTASEIFSRYQKEISVKLKNDGDVSVIPSYLRERKKTLCQEFASKLQSFLAAKGQSVPISKLAYPFCSISFNEKQFVAILNETVERPELTSRDKIVLGIAKTLREKGINFIEKAKDDFSRSDVVNCPYCQQPIDNTSKENLIKAIENVLDNHINEFLIRVKSFRLESGRFNLTIPADKFDALKRKDLINDFQNAASLLELKINRINSLVDEKIENLYAKINIAEDEININDDLARINESVKALNDAIDEYNGVIKKQEEKESELERLNNKIGFCEIYTTWLDYLRMNKELQQQNQILGTLKRESEDISKNITALEAEKRQVKIAVKEINASLTYIFFSKNRLQVEYNEKDDDYVIKVRGKDVKPADISAGERNAIALAYFFTDLKEEKEENTFYKNEYLLVIDDPISSFDRENRIGIESFLRRELIKFLKGNTATKILVLTHDMQVMLDMKVMFESMKSDLTDTIDLLLCSLYNNALENFNVKGTYTNSLTKIYKFACGEYEGHEEEIGNMMRRVLEAYGTFIYKEGGAYLFNSDKVLQDIQKSGHQDFFKNLMMRIGLNSESHMKESAQTLNDMNFFDIIPERKQKYAQFILCFLYCLNPVHVLIHLNRDKKQDENTIKKKIESWLNEIDEMQVN